ncbi:class I SAM-dependent rRNA methyltransferase [Vagococcus vulneris]|uniref:RlmI/RlmK family 23S rRNA methyltransferase n=1 Tax=Vagococcus vulneris TaxID=1977869 RepID=A0A430A216_9ENTE|nr:class I SAM-dependent rRNA methyltransferase [Vagococcus vulneris]RSU00513.1 RlmI/RlmK family 23S rRNA methyltransferase [Vagococcus vulneris]
MKKILINDKAKKRFKQGYPLVHQNDLVNDTDAMLTEWVEFVTSSGEFIGYGYLGQQNKGSGWIVSFNKSLPINEETFQRIFSDAFVHRQSFFESKVTDAFRIFNGEGDGLGGLTIDWYQGFLVVSWYNETIIQKKELIIHELTNILNEQVKGIYEKNRFNNDKYPETQHIYGLTAIEPLIVKENGVLYAVYLNEGLMTGIFLDQKDVRNRLIEGLACGKNLLNMFSYTGAFSIAALAGGASHTTSVDLAKRSIDKTREMFIINGINPDSQDIIVMDVFNYFKYATKKEKTFDCIVLDPPSFARNKKKTFSVAKNYSELVFDAVQILETNGVLIASSNAANVSVEKFEQMIESGIKKNQRNFKLLDFYQLPSDFKTSPAFKEGNYLKVFIYEIY